MTSPLRRASTVDELAAAIRARILDGELPPGRRLVERELTEEYDVARHTLRAALRVLEVEGLVSISPNRGARVATLTSDDLRQLFALRFALEREAAHLALTRHGGRLPEPVHAAGDRLLRIANGRRASWADVAAAHNALHAAVVDAAAAPRIARAYGALTAELQLFTSQLRPVWTREQMGSQHVDLLAALETDGAEALREHMAAAERALLEH